MKKGILLFVSVAIAISGVCGMAAFENENGIAKTFALVTEEEYTRAWQDGDVSVEEDVSTISNVKFSSADEMLKALTDTLQREKIHKSLRYKDTGDFWDYKTFYLPKSAALGSDELDRIVYTGDTYTFIYDNGCRFEFSKAWKIGALNADKLFAHNKEMAVTSQKVNGHTVYQVVGLDKNYNYYWEQFGQMISLFVPQSVKDADDYFEFCDAAKTAPKLGVTAAKSQLKAKPQNSAKTLATLKKGDQLVVEQELKYWYKVKFNEKVGYVTKQHVK